MSHSKRNTSLAFFTSYERSLLKDAWGSRSTRLTRDSFLPFESCILCLQIARNAVVCASNGDLFCRECAVQNLLSQLKEIKRLQRDFERKAREADEAIKQQDQIERVEALDRFEKTTIGLEDRPISLKRRHPSPPPDRTRLKQARQEIDTNSSEGASPADTKVQQASFWIPSQATTLKTAISVNAPQPLPPKKILTPLCPASSAENKHALSLKSLVSVNFTRPDAISTSSLADERDPKSICPACMKTLSNSIKAIITIPCGHVLCKPCATKLLTPHQLDSDPHNSTSAAGRTKPTITCFVCELDVTPIIQTGKSDQLNPPERGLVELRCEGTGFAGGGSNMVQKAGTAFQC